MRWKKYRSSESGYRINFPKIALPAVSTCAFPLCQTKRVLKKEFLWKIVTGDKKWIMYDNPKCIHSWIDPG